MEACLLRFGRREPRTVKEHFGDVLEVGSDGFDFEGRTALAADGVDGGDAWLCARDGAKGEKDD